VAADRRRRVVRGHLALYGVAFLVLGAMLATDEDRFDPAVYDAVFGLIHHHLWVAMLLGVGALKLAAAARWPTLVLPALVAGTLIVAWWAVSFTIALLTVPRFPPTGAVAWLCLTGSHLLVAGLVDPGGDWRGRRR
jgi:hypothetical protein